MSHNRHRGLRLCFLAASCGLLCALALVVVRARQAPWRVLQERFAALTPGDTGGGDAPAIRQYYTCAAEVDRCPTCHLGIGRQNPAGRDLALPFRPHGPALGAHVPDRVGCSACHGGSGRAIDPVVAHALPGREAVDPLMREPHIQAGCARCHVPGAQPGQERLEQGAWLYLGLGCMLCHPLGEGGRGGVDFGPDLKSIGRSDPDELETSLIDPTRNFPGSTMPSFRLALEKEPEALESLIIYLESLALERYPGCGTREASRALMSRPCATCHAGEAGHAGGRLRHRCTFLLRRADELRCANCHSSEIPPPGRTEGYCLFLSRHREACCACHEGTGSGKGGGE